MADSDVENSLQIPYNPDEWIGRGRTLPTVVAHIPRGLIDHFSACQQVPDAVKANYPLDSLKIPEFINFNAPKGTFDITGLKPQTLFTEVQPNIDGTCLQV